MNTKINAPEIQSLLVSDMTIRDYFAASISIGIYQQLGYLSDQVHVDELAKGAYRFADAMIRARDDHGR